ncbi:MAG: TetR/AcrR family transcriptional regulator [Spirochaetes bacterium]|nr:TetR/AcrR family transcriptional regulator [Spirochaetota bacterium]
MKNTPNARERILSTAIIVFAEKGYEGARMDQLAKAASVPKSLIYYHFKSKEDILATLVNQLIADFKKLIVLSDQETHQQKAAGLSAKRQKYQSFMNKNADLLRIIFIESLKKTNKNPILYEVCRVLIEEEKKQSGISKTNDYDKSERLVAEFFTNLIPNLAYHCFKESFGNSFKINAEKLEKLFYQVFIETHGAYHKNHQ